MAPPADPETSAPATSEPEITPDNPGRKSNPSVSLPRLPVGGSGDFVDETENLQCATVSWIVEQGGPAQLRSGIRIKITGFSLDKEVFRFTRRGCEDKGPTCVEYTFSAKSTNPACALAVWTRRPLSVAPDDDPQLGIAGTIECVEVSASACQDFVKAAKEGQGSVSLSAPSVDSPDDQPSDDQPSDDQPSDDQPSDGQTSQPGDEQGGSDKGQGDDSSAPATSTEHSSDEPTDNSGG